MTSIENLPKFEGNDKVNVYYGPGGHCVHYPTGRGDFINFIAIEHNVIWSEESWKIKGNNLNFLIALLDGTKNYFLCLIRLKKYINGVFLRDLSQKNCIEISACF